MPPVKFLVSVLVFSLSASMAISALAAALGRRFSAPAVKNILRAAFLLILLGLAFGSRVLPEEISLAVSDRLSSRRALTHLAWESAAVAAVIAAVLLAFLLKTRPEGPFAKIPMTENPDQGGR